MTLLLDFDNTIVNTTPVYRKAHNKLLNQNIPQDKWDEITRGLNVNQIADVLDKNFGIGDREVYINKARDVARDQILDTKPNQNIVDVTKYHTGDIFILSGNDTNLIRKYINKWNLPIKNNHVYGEMSANDKLKFIRQRKSKNIKEMFVMIDDNEDFILEAQKICSAIHYNNREHKKIKL